MQNQSSKFNIDEKRLSLIVIGMAGSGKTTFISVKLKPQFFSLS